MGIRLSYMQIPAIFLSLLICVASMPAFADQAVDMANGVEAAWQDLADGIASGNPPFRMFRIGEPRSPLYGSELCTYEAKNGAETLHVKDVRKKGAITSIYQESIPANASVALTGGFFGYTDRGSFAPLGLIIAEGHRINPRHPWNSGGVVQFRNKKIEIVPISSFSERSDILTAVQSKPLLVESGRSGIRSSNDARFDRSAIATTSDGQVMIVVLSTPTGKAATLAEFAALLLRIKTKAGGSIQWALALDGGPGAHLMSGGTHCGLGEPNYVPNLLYLQP